MFRFFEYYISIMRTDDPNVFAVCGKGRIMDDWTLNEWCTAEEIGQLLGGN